MFLKIINKYGWPNAKWDDDNTLYWTQIYAEAQVWSDNPVIEYKRLYNASSPRT